MNCSKRRGRPHSFMPHLPDFETFSKLANGHQLVPVYRRLLSDALTPVTAFHLLDRRE